MLVYWLENFYYCTSFGEIFGLLTINPFIIMFSPDISEVNKEKINCIIKILNLNDFTRLKNHKVLGLCWNG